MQGSSGRSGQEAMQTLLPTRSARIHQAGASESSTMRPPAASAAASRRSASSRATETSTCMAWRTGLSAFRSCIQNVDHGRVDRSRCRVRASSSQAQRARKSTSRSSGLAAMASWTSYTADRSATAPCCAATAGTARAHLDVGGLQLPHATRQAHRQTRAADGQDRSDLPDAPHLGHR
jgi:hypothetical protein